MHVYGYNTTVGTNVRASQHRGIGTTLLKKAEEVAFYNNYPGIVVISGEGVKKYYQKRGYLEADTFMYKDYYITLQQSIIIIIFTILQIFIFMIYFY